MLIFGATIRFAGEEFSRMISEYLRMEKAIRYIEENAADQPCLKEVAQHVGLSPFHFQKQFKRWAGVSPKRYLQFLTVENAKELLLQSASVLDTAFVVGLSSPGRLHDLFISVEALTPGQFKVSGEGMVIRYGYYDSPFGRCQIALSDMGICDLRFIDRGMDEVEELDLKEKWRPAILLKDNETVTSTARRIFESFTESATRDLKLDLRGTNFQIKVWQALLNIPEGSVVSYSDLARKIDRPDAVRAVAGAVGKNPIAYLIPCHRVLRKSGEIGDYRWGVARKRMILARELTDKYENVARFGDGLKT
jgi:AraC family transcriptional regulator of adaptative response/methylated-DNA-[protein]-cysteine methyltransferase